jgi:two-component system, NtrC family, sensor kinase
VILGLRARILLSLMVVTLGAITSVGAIAIWQTKQALSAERVERARRQGEAAQRLVDMATDPSLPLTSPPNRNRLSTLTADLAAALDADELVFFDDRGQLITAGAVRLASDGHGVAAALVGAPPHAEERPPAPGEPNALRLVTYTRVRGGAVRASFSVEAKLDAMLERARRTVVWLGAADGLLLLVVAAWLLRGTVVRPVQALERAARRVADGDLDARVEVRGPGELAHLADAFDRMTRSLRTSRESLIRSQNLAGVGRLAAGVAHEVGNPLAAILGYVETLLRESPDKPIPPELRLEILTRVRNETQRIHRIIQELLEYARAPRGDEVEAVDIPRVVEGALSLVRAQARLRDVDVSVDLPPDLPPVRATSGRLTQVLLNLLLNAADAIDGKGKIHLQAQALPAAVTTAGQSPATPGGVLIAVTDDGPGVPPDARAQIFDPFYTTKPPGKGTGLGLSVSLAIVESYGGTLRLADPPPNRGARFELALPAAQPSAVAKIAT